MIINNKISQFVNNNNVKRILIDANTYSLVRGYRKNDIRIDDYYTANMLSDDLNINDYELIVVHKSTLEGVNMKSFKFTELVETTNFVVFNSLSQ